MLASPKRKDKKILHLADFHETMFFCLRKLAISIFETKNYAGVYFIPMMTSHVSKMHKLFH